MLYTLRVCLSGAMRRRWVRYPLLMGVALCLAFLTGTAVLAYQYDLSLLGSAQTLGRLLALVGIQAGVRLYDPCTPRLAELGPGSRGVEQDSGLLRVEDFFQRDSCRNLEPMRRLQVVKIENETIRRCPFRFSYQPYDESRLHQLRKKYRLDEVIEGATCEFEQMVRLRSWTRSQFRRKDYQPLTANLDALEVLDNNHRNILDEPLDIRKHFDPCHFFPLLYCQIMGSMGHTARLMSINHGMAEVWSNQWKKWVAMDAELDWHYEKEGIPQSMMEMRDENFESKPSTIRIVRGTQSSGDVSTTLVHLKVKDVPVEAMIKYHLNDLTIVEMRNDWMTNHYFAGHPNRSLQNTLSFDDERLRGRKQIHTNGIHGLFYPSTSRRDDLYWTLNQTEIWVREFEGFGEVPLVFKTATPNFDYFEIQIDNREPIRSSSESFTWRLHDGENSFSVVALNKFGIRGIPSRIKLVI